MKIDFILPIKVDSEKRLNLFKQTIFTLLHNTPKEYINKIVIVDDLSTNEDFKMALKSLRGRKGFIIRLNKEQKGVGWSKNYGVELAKKNRGDFIYMLDGDVYFTDGWADKMINALNDNFKIVGGGIHPFLQPRINEDTELLTSHDAVSGWSWLLTYETWEKYGKLADNSIGTGKSEDWEYCQRIRNDGFKVGCLKNQVIAHCGMTNTEGEQIVGYNESVLISKSIAPEALLL